jgi:hypothetical protein
LLHQLLPGLGVCYQKNLYNSILGIYGIQGD